MIKVSVLYPNTNDIKFDMDYYFNTHVPMINDLLGDSLAAVTVDQGISGGIPGTKAPYHLIAHLEFNNMDDFMSSFAQHGVTLNNDIPNYTNVKPEIQISEVKL